MGSWTPRQPSPGLKARLFPQPAAEPLAGRAVDQTGTMAELTVPDVWALAWRWLTPAMALFIAAVVSLHLNPRTWTQLIASPSTPLVAVVALNSPDLAAYYSARDHSGHNAWGVATFDWTNGGPSLTTAAPVFITNSLIR